MKIDGLIQVAVALAFLAVGPGNLPKIIHAVRMAQIQLIQDSQASKWERAMLLHEH
ncbi:MAG: hypothetical protein HYW49_01135 [Deltaproteobacteria bacterium]|nr:hypothetical protein [Deltaproteobacteria bacterium]